MAWTWPWARRPGRETFAAERKQAGGYGFVALHAQGEARWTRRDYAALAHEGYMRNPVAHRAIRLIAEAAAAIPWVVYEGEMELDEHPLTELLARPNHAQAGPSFMEALYGHLLLSGNAFVERVETETGARELHLLRPDRVTVLADVKGWPVALEYRVAETRRRISLDEGGNGLHLKLFHPIDDHYGFPPLSAALQALDIHNAAARWNKALLDNSARPSGALGMRRRTGET